MLLEAADVVLIIKPSAPDLEITTSVEETEKPNCPVIPTLGTAVVPTFEALRVDLDVFERPELDTLLASWDAPRYRAGQVWSVDVTYHLTIAPVSLK